jgi:hypothetical protein
MYIFFYSSCRGNIILKLDGTNPTKLLLDKLQFVDDKNFLSKETELYIGLYNSDNKENQLDVIYSFLLCIFLFILRKKKIRIYIIFIFL